MIKGKAVNVKIFYRVQLSVNKYEYRRKRITKRLYKL